MFEGIIANFYDFYRQISVLLMDVEVTASKRRTVSRPFRWLNAVLALSRRYIGAPRNEAELRMPHATFFTIEITRISKQRVN
jgi:hypothetical protein